MSKRRPYIYQDREWAEIANIQEKVDVQGDEVPLSEFDQPYLYGNDEDDNYQPYEFDYPDPPPGGPYPVPDPVPIPGPCDQEGGCGFVTLVSVPETVQCEEEYWFRTIHVVHGCEPATFEDAFLVWSLHGVGTLTPAGVGAIYKAPENNDGATVVVCVSSIDGSCSDCRSFKIECAACCEEMVLVGADTANPSSIYSAAIDPPCPGAECTVTNNSGCPMECEVNPDGSTVTTVVAPKNCGSFTITVTEDTSTPQKQEDNCPGESATKTVRILGNGGSWRLCGFSPTIFCNGPFCGCSFIEGDIMWGISEGAGIFCGTCRTQTCYFPYDFPGPLPPGSEFKGSKFLCATDCPPGCPGGKLHTTSANIWIVPECECI